MLEKALESPLERRKSNQSSLKKINPEYLLEGLMLKLKLQYFGHLMPRASSWKSPWCWEILKSGGEGDDRRQDNWVASLTQWTGVWASSRRWWRTGKPGGCEESDMTEQLNNKWLFIFIDVITPIFWIFFSSLDVWTALKVKVKSLSCVRLFLTPWTVAYWASLSMGFSRQEYQSGLPFPSPGDLPDPGIKLGSPTLQADALPSEPPGKSKYTTIAFPHYTEK